MNYRTRTEDVIDPAKCGNLAQKICEGIATNVDVAVIGLSGGADSTLVACLCKLALGRDNVLGISMPYHLKDSMTFNRRSADLARKLRIRHIDQPIGHAAGAFLEMMYPTHNIPDERGPEYSRDSAPEYRLSKVWPDAERPNELTLGNLRSRFRMVYLYTYANTLSQTLPTKRVRVMGTGNLSEDYVAYDTKFGDSAADIFPIGELYKQEVYDLLDYFVQMAIIDEGHIDRVPSAGLWEGQTDEAELGYSYNEMAPAIEWLRQLQTSESDPTITAQIKTLVDPRFKEVTTFVWKRHLEGRHKHQAVPVLALRS